MKNILVLIHDDTEQDSRLRVAIDVVRSVSGHLVCLDILIPPEWGDESFTHWGLGTLLEIAGKAETSNRSAIEARLGSENVSWEMLEVTGDPGRQLPKALGFADLVIVNSNAQRDGLKHAGRIAGEIIIAAKRPVLAVPPRCNGFDPCGKVIIAWDGEVHANEAMRAALPLLGQAFGVTLLTINEPTGPLSIDDAALYLNNLEIDAGALTLTTDETVADAILKRAHAEDARYVVMGAFGHGRMPEAVFGGVTRSLLQKSDLPLLLFH